ncbi:hypothetical protein [Aestuariivirga sp.]|uniref:hypothetical protein n=1 Tax=Aestuariivirga sp. TaxID=2650926 RepID=UPI003BA8EE8D
MRIQSPLSHLFGLSDLLTHEADEGFCERINGLLKEHLTPEDYHRLRLLLSRGAATQWRPFVEAPKGDIDVLAFREDAGAFTAIHADKDAFTVTPTREPTGDGVWFSTSGEDLSRHLPTHFILLSSLGSPEE